MHTQTIDSVLIMPFFLYITLKKLGIYTLIIILTYFFLDNMQ